MKLFLTCVLHDHGMAVPMKSGKVLVCGGANEPLGIGQTYTAEWYDPATHTCEGFGCMDMKIVGMTPSEWKAAMSNPELIQTTSLLSQT